MVEKILLLKALADPTRIDILRSVVNQDCQTSCSEVSSCSQLSQPALSHHFKKLVDAGVLDEEKKGKQKFYCVNKQKLLDAGIDYKKLLD